LQVFFLIGGSFSGKLHYLSYFLNLIMPYVATRRPLSHTCVHVAEPGPTCQIIYPSAIFIIVDIRRSAQGEIFTGDVLKSNFGGPATSFETDFDVGTQDYSISTVLKVYILPSAGRENPKEDLP
jgi:hypothetical protein